MADWINDHDMDDYPDELMLELVASDYVSDDYDSEEYSFDMDEDDDVIEITDQESSDSTSSVQDEPVPPFGNDQPGTSQSLTHAVATAFVPPHPTDFSTPSTSNRTRRSLDSPGEESAAKRPCTESESQPSTLETSTSDEGSMCTICYDNWTTTGPHRLISLKCGHLFGNSCIETWFKNFNSRQKARCPQCNTDAKKSDIRPIFAKNIKTIDTSEREKFQCEIQLLKKRRSEIEQALIQRDEQIRALDEKIENLKTELMKKDKLIEVMRSKLSANPNALRNATNLPGNVQESPSFPQPKATRFKPVHSAKIAHGGARCMATSKTLDTIAVSVQSKLAMFPGFGVIRISAQDLKQSDFIYIHKSTIKEMVFKPADAVLLSTSYDKTLKLTSLVSKQVVQTIELEDHGWSCCWNPNNTSICYVGLGRGVIAEYDIRQPNAPVNRFSGMSDKPVTAVQFVSPNKRSGVNHTPIGLIGCSLDKCYFYELNESSTLESSDYLPFHGRCLPVHFDRDSAYGLISMRPSTNSVDASVQPPSICHKLFELKKEPSDPQVTCQVVKTYRGGNISNVMPRSRVFMPPEPFSRDVLVFAADEQNRGFLIWDTHAPDSPAQVFRTDNPVLDIDLVTMDQRMRVAALTESSIHLYERL